MARTRFRRRADYLTLAVIVVACLAVAGTVWAKSDVRHTISQVGPAAVATPPAPSAVPSALRVAWHAPSAATPVPLAIGPTVVTGDNGNVRGRDPLTGKVRWRYARNLSLCTVSSAWSMAIAVYRKGSGWCSEVSTLNATTGARGPQRNGDVDDHTRLISDGTYVTATGGLLNETWRSDLVRTMKYGKVPNFNIAGAQPHAGCVHRSEATAAGAIGVLEQCAGEHGERLTVYQATAKDSSKPDVAFSTVLDGRGAKLVTMTDKRVAVAFPDRLEVRDVHNGKLLTRHPLHLPASDFAGAQPSMVVPTTSDSDAVYWYTGSSTISLSSSTLSPQWTVKYTLGPGAVFAGRLLLPVPGGLAVTDERTGTSASTIPVDRNGYRGQVEMSTLGPVVLEQRGDTLVALTARP
ncbi:MAG: Rv3212 family protein [Sciscionella sp.]